MIKTTWKRKFLPALSALLTAAMAFALFPAAPAALALDISGSVYGDQFGDGSLPSSTDIINISGGTVNLQSGGNVTGRVFGGATNYGNVSVSSVHVTGGTASRSIYGGFVQSSGNVTGNSITFDSGNMNRGLYGGRTPNGTAENNEVHINGGTVNTSEIYGGYTNSDSNTTGNKVVIGGGSVTASMAIAGGASASSTVSGNSVTISGGTIGANTLIAGGVIIGSSGSAVNNIVTISGAPVFGTAVNFYGGYDATASLTTDFFRGNTLQKDSSVTISSAANFESVKFGYSGDAGIDSLNLTPAGASSTPPVKLDTGAHNVAFGGLLIGTGGIEKQGTGTLTLSGTNTYSGDTIVNEGTLVFTSMPPSSGAITAFVGAKVTNNTGINITVNGETVASGGTYFEGGGGGGTTDPGGGCDAGLGIFALFALGLLQLASVGRKRKAIPPKD